MIYKKIVIPVCTVIALLCSCGIVSDDTSSDSVTSVTEVTGVTVTEIPTGESVTTKSSLVDKVAYYGDFGYYLYDFDSDGMPELFKGDWWYICDIAIFKIVNDEIIPVGNIPYSHNYFGRFTVSDLTLYYDKSIDEYFYVAEYDCWQKDSNWAEVNKYVFTDDEIIVTNIARCELVGIDEQRVEFVLNKLLGEDTTPIGILNRSEIVRYYDGVEEYLSQFEKIKEITYEELTAVSIKDAINSGTLADYLP